MAKKKKHKDMTEPESQEIESETQTEIQKTPDEKIEENKTSLDEIPGKYRKFYK